MTAKYSVVLHNRTNNTTDDMMFCLYLQVPSGATPGIKPLAWQSDYCAFGNDLYFEWEMQYALQWAMTGPLKNGSKFLPSGSVDCDPNDAKNNAADLCNIGKTYRLQSRSSPTGPGHLHVISGADIAGGVCAGVSIGGKSVFATQANSNMDHLFIMNTAYYVTLGVYEQGEVIDRPVTVIPFAIEFGSYHKLDITLDHSFNWTQKVIG